MAISARIPSTLEANKFIPEIFSKNVLVALKNKLVVVPLVNHSYEKELEKGKVLYIPQTNVTSATEVTVGTEGVSDNVFNTAHIALTIDQWWERNVNIDTMSTRQSHVDLQKYAEDEVAYAISKKMDSTLCALFSAFQTGTIKGTEGSAWTDTVMRTCVELLDAADIDPEDRVWVGNPSVKTDILGIDMFTRADYFAGEAIPTGQFRKNIYGAPLYTTNNLTAGTTGAYGVYMHRDALAIAITDDFKPLVVERPLQHQIIVHGEALWGVKELRNKGGVAIWTRSK